MLLLLSSSSLLLFGGAASAFVPLGAPSSSSPSLVRRSMDSMGGYSYQNGIPGGGNNPLPVPVDPTDQVLAEMFPTDIPIRKMQGGGTVRTWDIPADAERLMYYVRTGGRPLKALVELVRFAVGCV
jgi:hypothetical protein